jgi:hypothetical protein
MGGTKFYPPKKKPFSFGNLYGKAFSFGRLQNFQLDPQKLQDMSQRSGPKR